MKNRRFRRSTASASPRTRHNGATPPEAAESPQPPHAATVPTPTDLYAGAYRYEAGTIPGLREHAQRRRAQAGTKEQKANQLLSEAARDRVLAADLDRLAALAEQDAQTPDGAQWPTPAPQVPAQPAPVVHFSDRVAFWPPCGARTEATWQSVNPAEVTCPGCLASMAQAQASPIGAEPRTDFGPPRPPVNGWGESPELPDTLTMPAVGAR